MAKNYRKSDYAKNKYSEGIIYTFVDGTEIEITYSAVMEADSSMSQEKFEDLKRISDAIFKEDVEGDDVYSKHVKTTYEQIEGGEWLSTKSFEHEYFEKQEDDLRVRRLLNFIDTQLSETQKRRLKLYMSGLSSVKIAEKEGCNQNAVWKSINQAKEKIEKFLMKFSK